LELIEKHGVTHTLCLPSLYRVLISFAEQKQLDSLSVVIVAGEACASDLVKLHYARVPKAKLFNEYGPTEGTVWSTACELTLQNSEHGAPIGKPIPNATNYILDSNLKPVPIGVVGELFIGGDGISRGYWNREALTSERFFEIKDWAFSNSAKGCYVYRTGDLARYRADGTIEYLGRGDQQIKIRGHRVELEEIESALREINLIEDVVVIAKTSARITDEQLSEMLSEMPSDKVEKLLEEISAMTS
jgi:non-ribosomal peptide synthetase component F